MPSEKNVAVPKKLLAQFVGRGLTSKKDIAVKVYESEPDTGVIFALPAGGGFAAGSESDTTGGSLIEFPASVDSVVNTLRNVTIGRGKLRLSIVEHFLCAVALSGLNDLYVEIDGPELPLGNGSCDFWMELFATAGIARPLPQATLELSAPITITRKDRVLMAVADESFSVTYLMDYNHPKIGRMWRTWTPSDNVADIAMARTFSTMAEHKLLGLVGEVVSMTDDGFDMPLRFDDEPVRHKLLDLIGDLMLTGINPLSIKARFISIKGGHEMDVEMARLLKEQLKAGQR